MSSINRQAEPGRAFSSENVPPVEVRAGKHLLCSACGVTVEVPASVVGRLVATVEHSSQDAPITKSLAQEPSTPQEPVSTEPSREVAQKPQLSRTKRRKPLPGNRSTGRIIDGLRVPSAGELERAFAWVSFHLKVLDRQGSELHRLQKLLKQRSTQQGPCSASRIHGNNAPALPPIGQTPREVPTHAQAVGGMAPTKSSTHRTHPAQGRGPP
ncbi:hypothetical protein [Bremerella alba]|uniref:Uncharacterized protein n=1 Tax=Bremerella alba TaxID=980252 RepID=A0A7V8V1V6_9BACT|nr:hypothetical protein [Bremerella alba]MBA2113109.1 hypothetical protein [Bremerella alba]